MEIFRLPMRHLAGAATVTVVLVTGSGAAAGHAPEPLLEFVAATETVMLDRYEPDGPVMSLDLGTYLVAGAHPVEIWSQRTSYRDPIVSRLKLPDGRFRTLPAGLVTDLSGFNDFTHVTFTDAAGEVAQEVDVDYCPNVITTRVDATAPDASPYPEFCPTNPFALGAVWGVQAGWNSATLDQDGYGDDMVAVPDGDYTVTVEVNQPYRSVLGLSDAKVEVRATVRTLDESARAGARRATAAPGTAGPVRPVGASRVPRNQQPDLRPLPAWWIELDPEAELLAFDATLWNAGKGPLVLDGFRRPGTDVMDAYQYFYDRDGKQAGFAPAGTFDWQPGDVLDGHWIVTDLVRYRLLDAAGRVAATSDATGHCVLSGEAVDQTRPGANWRPGKGPVSGSCGGSGSLGVRQVLDVGSGETWAMFLPGGAFDVSRLGNGAYFLEVTADPEGHLHESNTRNNVSKRKVVLGGEPGARTLRVPPHQGIDR